MQIHQIITKNKPKRKTIGRGGKRGTYSGKGMKGQKSRSGVSIDPLFEGGRSSLIDRMKKIRGFKSMHPKKIVIKLETLEKTFSDGDSISMEALVNAKLVGKNEVSRGAKILSGGEISKKLTIEKDILVSQSAKQQIEKAGGKVTE